MAHVLDPRWRARPLAEGRRFDVLVLGGAALVALAVFRFAIAPPTPAVALAMTAPAADILGPAQINDDGLFIDGRQVRLSGVILPTLDARCGDVECGLEARRALHEMIAGGVVACQIEGLDGDIALARCAVNGRDLGDELQRRGLNAAA